MRTKIISLRFILSLNKLKHIADYYCFSGKGHNDFKQTPVNDAPSFYHNVHGICIRIFGSPVSHEF